ncbi:MAG: hypothetical protein ACRDHD_02930 [Candidatus Limnocylindria bacterium]
MAAVFACSVSLAGTLQVTATARALNADELAAAMAKRAVSLPLLSLGAGETLDPLPDVPAPSSSDPISDAEMQDLETLAAHYGMGIDDAIARFAWNDNFSIAVDQIRQRFPAEFAGARIESASSAWVSFAGRPPSEALAVLEEFGRSSPGLAVDVEVVANRGFTESKLDEAVQSVHYALMASPLVLSASSGYDIQTGLVSSQVILAEGVDESRVRELQDLADSLLPAHIEAVVSVARTSSLSGIEAGADWHYGGEDITGCTSGFTAKTSSGSRRVVTAGHCGNAQTDDGDSLPFNDQYSLTHGDFQSHTGTEPIYDNFYAGNARPWR